MKRLLDIVASFSVLVEAQRSQALLPGRYVASWGALFFFGQTRPGLHGRPFQLIKFRTMTDERGTDGNLLPGFGTPSAIWSGSYGLPVWMNCRSSGTCSKVT